MFWEWWIFKWDGHRGVAGDISLTGMFRDNCVGLLSSKPRSGTLFCRQQGDSTVF